MARRPPTVPLYVRIPVELRTRLDAAVSADPERPWITRRLQEIVIEALYKAFPGDDPEPTTTPETPKPTAAPTRAPARTRKRSPGKKRTTRTRPTPESLGA